MSKERKTRRAQGSTFTTTGFDIAEQGRAFESESFKICSGSMIGSETSGWNLRTLEKKNKKKTELLQTG